MLIDYPRMIQFAVKRLQQMQIETVHISQFTHILVDEFQDINFAQKLC